MSEAQCPICQWAIKQPIAVIIAGKTVNVCCEECAEQLRAQETTPTT